MTRCISNKRIREKALRNESLETNNARDCSQSCGYLSKWTSFLPFRVQLQDVSNRVQKWNVGKFFTVRRIWNWKKGRETFRGCFGKRTPFLRLRAQLHQDVSLPIQLHKIKERTSANLLMSFFVSCVVEFEKAETQAFLALSARLFKSLTAKFEPSSSLNAFSHILTFVPTWSQISS